MHFLRALARPIAPNLSVASSSNSVSLDPATGECIDINGCRTTTTILWSCLSVIFICTWVAIHPNIPNVNAHWAAVLYQNIELMIIALLAPEFMILWAMRQREQAKVIREKFKRYRWGMSHGFFVIMGGLALYDGDVFCGYLWDRNREYDEDERPYEGQAERFWDVIKRHQERYQDPIQIQEARSRENEKVLQSPMTSTVPEEVVPSTTSLEPTVPPTVPQNEAPSTPEPEPATILEFLVANGYITITEEDIKDNLSHSDAITKSIAIIQTTWFILQVITRAVEGIAITELEIITVGFAILNFGTYVLWWNKPLRVRHPLRVYWRHQRPKNEEKEVEVSLSWVSRAITEIVGYIWDGNIPKGSTEWILTLMLLPLRIPLHILHTCARILRDQDDSKLVTPISSRLDNDPRHLYIIVYGIATLFGAIHCIPWFFFFPTHTEQLLWRISAVAVAAAPIATGTLHGCDKLIRSAPVQLLQIMDIFGVVLCLAYIFFRITLIVIAFTALRDLSPTAFRTVQWTTFIPHIG